MEEQINSDLVVLIGFCLGLENFDILETVLRLKRNFEELSKYLDKAKIAKKEKQEKENNVIAFVKF